MIDKDGWLGIIIVFLVIVGIIGGVVWLGAESERRWQTFVVEHNCEVVEKINPTTTTGTGIVYGANGKPAVGAITQTTPGKTVWACGDGVKYTR